MAEVFLAKTRGLAGFEKFVALKQIHSHFSADEQFVDMLINEAKLTVRLQHVNIAQTFDLGRVGDTYYLTMEYVDGADLYQLLRRGAECGIEMPIAAAAHIAHEIAVGLSYAHRKRDKKGRHLGIVHRDISPQNVLISRAGEVKLVDFGIAKASRRAQETQVGVIKGKYYYMSPEQAWGDRVDARTDIFSAGIVLYEMLTGQMLYYEEDLHKLLDRVRQADIAMPSNLRQDLPTDLERIVMRTLRRRPEDRYQSAAALANDVQKFLNSHAREHSATAVAQWAASVLSTMTDEPASDSEDAPSVVQHAEPLRPGEFQDENSLILAIDDALKLSGMTLDGPVNIGTPTPMPLQETRPMTDEEAAEASASPQEALALAPTGNATGDNKLALAKTAPVDVVEPPDADDVPTVAVPTEDTVPLSKPDVLAAAAKIRRRMEISANVETSARRPSEMFGGASATQLCQRTEVTDNPFFPGGLDDDDSEDVTILDARSTDGPNAWGTVPSGSVTSEGFQVEVGSPDEVAAAPLNQPPSPAPYIPEPSGLSQVQLQARSRWWLWAGVASLTVAAIVLATAGNKEPAAVPPQLELVSSPEGATVSVNGTQLAGTAPVTYDASKAEPPFEITFELAGYDPSTKKIQGPLSPGTLRVVTVMHRTKASISIRSTPPGAEVHLNNVRRGLTPLELRVTPDDATSVELRKKGFRPVYRDLTWNSDETEKSLDFRLRPARRR